MKRSILPALLLLCLASLPLEAFQIDSLSLHMKLTGLKEAEPPQVLENHIVMSAKGPYHFVGAAFESEGFAQIHGFEKNREGVFVLALPVPLKSKAPLAYRLIVDGTWMADPQNPLRTLGRSGVELSLLELPYLSDEVPGLYSILESDGRTARFLFKGEPGMYVTVAGTFNNWDPFLYPMEETSPGTYALELVLPPGRQYYAFVYDGERHYDPFNQEKATSRDGQIASVLMVSPARD
jgi:hypothetical protein